MALVVEHVVVPPFMENSYVVGDSESSQAILVDPGGALDQLAAVLARHGWTPIAIVNTHAHIDHVAGVAAAKARFGVPFHLHEDDRPWIEALPQQAAMFGFPPPPAVQVDHWLADGEEIAVGTRRCRIIHTPGHTSGGCCLFFPDDRVLLTGDTLFRGSIGRTDLPGGSQAQIVRSIRERLFTLGDDVVIHPGHESSSTIGHERKTNPFVGD